MRGNDEKMSAVGGTCVIVIANINLSTCHLRELSENHQIKVLLVLRILRENPQDLYAT